MRTALSVAIAAIVLATPVSVTTQARQASPLASLKTRPERSNYEQTSRYADVIAFIEAVQQAAPKLVHLTTFGYTNEGRALPLAVIGAPDASPESVKKTGKLRVYLVLNNVRPGQHTIKVYKGRANNRGNGSNRNRNNRNDILYSSTIYVKPNYDVDIMINRFGKALVDERDLRYSNDGRNNGNYGDNNGGYGNGGYGNNNGYNRAINDYDFNQLLQKIRGQWFGKINTAKEGINNNYFATQQVKQILQLFSSENEKLELAKLAYRNTVDQRNYTQIYDVFAYQNSKDELDQYIRNNRW